MGVRATPIFAAALFAAACAPSAPPVPPDAPRPAAARAPAAPEVQAILEGRCIVCHGCYDAPCQLLLSSNAGIERGASKEVVYAPNRLTEMAPTRLFIDAHGAAAWRERGFFSVGGDPSASDTTSLLLRMLELGRQQTFAPGDKLPQSVSLDTNRALTCANAAEFDSYAADHPLGGMPYATAPLGENEFATLVAWAAQGAPPPAAALELPPAATDQIARWETFLNGDSRKQQLTARYLYEHWFLAHLSLQGLPGGPFFRVVRSRTPPGVAVDEIAARRPYDAPGVTRFWYRLLPLEEAIVHKTHIVYPLSDAKMRRLSELFLASDWAEPALPGYAPDEAANPFITFAAIPPRARYQFLLDDAQYFIMTFIRGPVCRGQVAVDVIEDHFFVTFLDPDHDLSVISPSYLDETKHFLNLPAENLSRLAVGEFWAKYGIEQRRYLALREKYYDAFDREQRGPTLDFVWDGDGHNSNAQLTVFRHFDSASVERGFVGAIPKTAWTMDFPIFERIYYNLVAGYDVFGNVAHQAATRLYMDHLRMQAENLFLTFLPPEQREAIRATWYVGAEHSLNYTYVDKLHALSHGTQIPFRSADPKRELLEMIAARDAKVSGAPDLLNRCAVAPCNRPGASALERRAERALQPLTNQRGAWVAPLPEVVFLRVRDAAAHGSAVYTLVHNRAHTNVAYMFGEEDRLVPADDTLTVTRGTLGSYPNFFFDVEAAQIEAFTAALTDVRDAADLDKVVERWGVRRTSARFWSSLDWLHDDFRRRQPAQFGLFDIGRYGNY